MECDQYFILDLKEYTLSIYCNEMTNNDRDEYPHCDMISCKGLLCEDINIILLTLLIFT